MDRPRILVVDGDAEACAALSTSLRERGFEVAVAVGQANVAVALMTFTPDAVLARAEAEGDGPALLRLLRSQWCDSALVAVASPDRLGPAIEAMRAGADSYLPLPMDGAVAAVVLEKALERRRMRREAGALRDEIRKRQRVVGEAPELRTIQEVVRRAAPTKATVLVVGESGAGRTLIAQSIHDASPRRDRPFVRVSCAARSETLMDVALFGVEAGALGCFPRRRDGALHAADGGTLFLQEVAQLPPAVQVKLLRVIQTGELERVGGREATRVDVRILAATTGDLAEEVRAGRFRDDLYYRLNVVSVALPPLRQRKADIPALLEHFLTLASATQRKDIRAVSPGALSILFAYDWPGNVRELQAIVDRAVAVCAGQEITRDHLPAVLQGCVAEEAGAGSALIPGATLFEIEREAILRTLDEVGGSTARAADVLGISVRKIQYRLKEYRRGHLERRDRPEGPGTPPGTPPPRLAHG